MYTVCTVQADSTLAFQAKRTNIERKLIASPTIILLSFEFAPPIPVINAVAALFLFSSVLLIVAISASVSPVPFRQVSLASGWFDNSGDEADLFCGMKRVRIGTMLDRFSVMDAA